MANGVAGNLLYRPGVRAVLGEGIAGESRGSELPPLEASVCNPADHPIASGRGLVNLRVVCGWCPPSAPTVLVPGDPGAATSHGMCKTCEGLFIQESGGLLDHFAPTPSEAPSPTCSLSVLEAAVKRAEFVDRLFGREVACPEGGAR